MTISRGLGWDKKNEISFGAHDLITDYVEAVVLIWQQEGLRPGRATRRWDSTYRSRAHRCADLVLTSVVEPWLKRHDGDQTKRLASLRKAHAQLPPDIRKIVRAGLRRGDVEWLVREDHVKKAPARVQKSGPQTP